MGYRSNLDADGNLIQSEKSATCITEAIENSVTQNSIDFILEKQGETAVQWTKHLIQSCSSEIWQGLCSDMYFRKFFEESTTPDNVFKGLYYWMDRSPDSDLKELLNTYKMKNTPDNDVDEMQVVKDMVHIYESSIE